MSDSSGSDPRAELQERISRLILDFENRLDAMEVRHEETCRVLAWRISEMVEKELQRRRGAD